MIKKIQLNQNQKKYIFLLAGIIVSVFLMKIFIDENIKKENKIEAAFLENKNFKSIKEYILKKIISPYINISHKIKPGESLGKVLKNYNIDKKDVGLIVKEFKTMVKNQQIYPENLITIVAKKEKTIKIEEITIPITKTININISKNDKNEFFAKKEISKLYKKILFAQNSIKNNLYSAALEKKIKPNIIIEFARLYGFEIDFQRDIRKNDTFQIMYENFYDENNEFIKSGTIIFASMFVNNREISLYRFGDNKNYSYFSKNGKSVEKALMKTPINGARLSSPFGKRKHPILGYNKMHKGTDFAAKSGTPIMASGTGTIIKASWCGGGGNCIKIKHNSTYQTVYAHLKKFARGIKVGKKVRQGQIIGYVGSTGMSTGPHLHYEVLINGKQVNSQKLKLPSGKVLKGKERQDFEIHRIKTDVKIAELLSNS